MKKIIFAFVLVFSGLMFSQPKFSSIAGMPGAFSRMGFGARGIGMGNAMSAVTHGNLVSYYNPAVTVFQNDNLFQSAYSFLSLDRSLNFINFTRRFDFYSPKDTSLEIRKPASTAGISIGIINSGVSNIDGRDNQGVKTGELSTSENQFFIGLANRFSKKISVGIQLKYYYYKLYENITTSAVGFDIGALYRINDQWNLSLVITDLNSKYKWDTSPVYQQDGTNTIDNFPVLKKLGVSYYNNKLGLLASAEYETSNAETNILRLGIEYNIVDGLYLRSGLDQFNLSNKDYPIKPAFGFSYYKKLGSFLLGVDYAFMIEQYSPQDRHIVGVNINF